MKITAILFTVGLMIFPAVGLAQVSNTPVKFSTGTISPKTVAPMPEQTPVENGKNLCGDGICQDVACLALGCPSPETPQSCPRDCQKTIIIKPLPDGVIAAPPTLISEKEIRISREEIKADGIAVQPAEKKVLVNVRDRPVSIEPATNSVLIRDKDLEVKTDEITIKEDVLSVGGAKVKVSASEIVEKLGIAPKTIELKKKGAKAIYSMKIKERRKLFGFIPFSIQKTVVADAENGNLLSEYFPWYSFLTTKQ